MSAQPSMAERQAGLLASGWPWPSIPSQYRRAGRPPAQVSAAARESIGHARERARLPILTLTGPVGTGKTTAACQAAAWVAAAKDWTGEGDVRYLLALRMGWVSGDEAAELTSEGTRLLIIDDLSAGLTAAGLANALALVEGRSAWRLRTLVTTSLSLDQIAALEVKHHGREIGLASRLAGGGVVHLSGDDLRMAHG